MTPLLRSQPLLALMLRRNIRLLRKAKGFDRILVISDIHFGDAIMLQASLSGLRDFFPDSEIDYVVKKSVGPLIDGNPEISTLHAVFTGGNFPNEADVAVAREISAKNYDVIFNFCPFFDSKELFPKDQIVIALTALFPILLRNEKDEGIQNHVVYQARQYIHRMFSSFMKPERQDPYHGVRVTLGEDAIRKAQEFLTENQVSRDRPIILYNPETTSRFTRPPFEQQASLLGKITNLPCTVLLGSGYTEKDLELRLLETLSPEQKAKVVVIPKPVSIDVLTVLIDFADVFVTGDTGPLHLGAARKFARSGDFKFRNKTAVFSMFGATPSRMYAYATNTMGYLAANQDAPSFAYVGASPCRNVTCMHKMAKTCKTVRCFDGLDVSGLATDVSAYLATL